METKSVQLKIDGQVVKARLGISVLQAAAEAGLYIPALCELDGLLPGSSCRCASLKLKTVRHSSQPVPLRPKREWKL